MDENLENTQPEDAATEKSPEISNIEKQAMDMGWRPKDEFQGEEDDFIDAKEFVRRKPLFDKIEHQNRQIKQVSQALAEFKEHYSKVEKVAVQKAIEQLRTARREALSEGDGERFDLIDDQIKNAENQLRTIEASKNTSIIEEEPHPDFVAFKNKNSWYQNDPELTQFADKLGYGLAATGMEPSEVLKEIENQVRGRYPHKFKNKNKELAPETENSRQPANQKDKEDASFLSDVERKIMNDLARQGVLTREQYIKDLKKIKGIK